MCPWGLCLNYPRHCVGWDLEFLAMTQINMSSYNLSTAVLGWFYDDGKSIPWLPASCPKMVAVALRWVWGEREALRLISGLFQSLTLRHLGSQCGLGLCLASMGVFVSPDRSFFFVFPWPWRGCSSNSSAAFRSELDGLVLVRDQRVGGKMMGLSILAPHLGKSWASKRKLTCFICCEEEANIRDSLGFTSVCPNCCLNLLGLFFFFFFAGFSLKAHVILSQPSGKLMLVLVFFFFSPWYFGVLFHCVSAWGWRGLNSDNSISSIYLLFTVPCGYSVCQ